MEIKETLYDNIREIALNKLNQYYIDKGSYCDNYNSSFHHNNKKISFIAVDNGQILGYILGYFDDIINAIKIEILFVEDESRGKNVGKELIKAIENIAKYNNISALFVDTTITSAPIFYEKLGYKLIASLKDFPLKDETYYMYWKNL